MEKEKKKVHVRRKGGKEETNAWFKGQFTECYSVVVILV
jgi:hypothetical protein